MNNNTLYYLSFSYFIGIGPGKFQKLLNHFGSLVQMYSASSNDLAPIIGEKLAREFVNHKKIFDPEGQYKKIKENNIHIVTREDSQYPAQLRELHDPPICLYVKGNMHNHDYERDLFFAIVGTRNPTEYGEYIAKKFAHELVDAGFTIVSGMARGIDGAAHWSAVNAGGKTIAFLGCGVNIIYPPSNRALYESILNHDGLIISEFPPDMVVQKGLFVSRNRLIAGLSEGVLVAEGLKDSGSLITAHCALDMGKDVFAPPAPINSDQSAAPNMLLKHGAKLVTTVEDILEEYNMALTKKTKEETAQSLEPEERKVYEFLLREPASPDDISRNLSVPIYQILMVISTLELRNIIQKSRSGKYQVM